MTTPSVTPGPGATKKVHLWTVPMLILGIFLARYFVGIGFWFLLAIILLFTVVQYFSTGGNLPVKSKSLAFLFAGLFILGLGDSYWQANYPRSYAKSVVLKARVDQSLGLKMGDETKTKANDIWEFQKTEHGKKFLDEYNRLLKEGKPKKAFDTLQAFNRQWDMEKMKKDEDEKNHPSSQSSAEGSRSSGYVSQSGLIVLPNGSKVFNLKAGEETPWFGTPEGVKTSLSMASPTYDFRIFVSDGTDYPGNATLPMKKHCYFKIKANSAQFVTVTVL